MNTMLPSRDITDPKCADCVFIQESETRFRDLADLLPQIVFELDENLIFTFFNWNAIRITGFVYDDQSQNRSGIMDIIRESDRQPVERFFSRIRQEITSDKIECRIVAHEGREIPVIIYASPVIGETCIAGFHGVIVDITEKIQFEKALELTNQKLNMMNSVTRHDILNNITGTLGLCDMLADITTDNNAQVLVSDIRGQVVKIKDQILFTRDYQCVGVKSPQWQSLCQSVRDAVSAIGRDTVRMHLPGTDAEIFADPFFSRVFYNLIDNSFRHGGSIRNISIETEVMPEGSLMIRYRDDGTGVSPGEKLIIFEQGYGKNTGFGLFFIREVLAITGMTIQETGTFGSGVLFEITVPKTAWKPYQSETIQGT